jgi:hypothetical protein
MDQWRRCHDLTGAMRPVAVPVWPARISTRTPGTAYVTGAKRRRCAPDVGVEIPARAEGAVSPAHSSIAAVIVQCRQRQRWIRPNDPTAAAASLKAILRTSLGIRPKSAQAPRIQTGSQSRSRLRLFGRHARAPGAPDASAAATETESGPCPDVHGSKCAGCDPTRRLLRKSPPDAGASRCSSPTIPRTERQPWSGERRRSR